MARWTPPPPPRAHHQLWLVAESAMAAATSLTELWFQTADAIAYEVSKNFTNRVGFNIYRTPHLASVAIEASTALAPGHGGYEPKDTPRVKEALLLAIWDHEGLDLAELTAHLSPPPAVHLGGALTNLSANYATSKGSPGAIPVSWGTGSVSGLSGNFAWNFTSEHPAPPPEPEPMWSPTAVYGFRSFQVNIAVPPQPLTDWSQTAAAAQGEMDYAAPGVLVGNVVEWPGRVQYATCINTTLSMGAIDMGYAPKLHEAPHWGCHCGIYVCNEPQHSSVNGDLLIEPHYALWGGLRPSSDKYARRVIALVKLTGTVIEHKQGARGARGEIVRLWAGPEAVEVLRAEGRYHGVEITPVHPPELEMPDIVLAADKSYVYTTVTDSYTWDRPYTWDRAPSQVQVDAARADLLASMVETRQRYIATEEEKWLKSENRPESSK